MAAPQATYPRRSCQSCATWPWVRGLAGMLAWSRIWGCRARLPKGRGSAGAAQPCSSGRFAASRSFLPLSQPKTLCPGVMGEGNPKLGVSRAPWQLRAPEHRGTKGTPGRCGTAGAAVTISDLRHHTDTGLQSLDFRGHCTLKTLPFQPALKHGFVLFVSPLQKEKE